jgi:hypothetical protein
MSLATWSTEQMMLEMVHDRKATGVTTVVWTAAVLWCRKQWKNCIITFPGQPHSENRQKYYEESKRKGTSYINLKRREVDCIGHTIRRNCLLKQRYWRKDRRDGKMRRRKQLFDELKETRRYRKLKEEALDRTLWRTRFGRGNGPVVKTDCVMMMMMMMTMMMTTMRTES